MSRTEPVDEGTSHIFGECEECHTSSEVSMGNDGNMYCDECWNFYGLRNTRCFSFAALYDSSTGKRIVTDGSQIGFGCAERMAMWKLPFNHNDTPKIAVVARIRRNRNNKKITFGISKPCQQCIQAMPFYNIERVCYSTPSGFIWENVQSLKNDYTSCSPVIVKF